MPYTGPTGSPITISLTGNGSTSVAFSPNPITFPSTALGGFTSAINSFLTNGTGSSVTITNTPAITGTNPSDFSIAFTSCITGTLISSGSSSCEVSINFNPTARGSRTAQLVYTLSAGSPITLNLNGTATGPVMGLAPSPVTFPSQIVNTQSASMFVTVSNTGDNVLSISKETLTGANGDDFSFPSFVSCFSVAPGSSCTIAGRVHALCARCTDRVADGYTVSANCSTIGRFEWYGSRRYGFGFPHDAHLLITTNRNN